jgi:hypothetical protein
MSCQVIRAAVLNRLESQASEDLPGFGARNCPNCSGNGLPEFSGRERSRLTQPYNGNTIRFDARYICKYSAAADCSRYVPGFDAGLDFSFARGIDIGRARSQFAALVNSNDDAVSCSSRRSARSRKIFLCRLLVFRAVTDKTMR